jgi:putative transposase
MPDYRRYYIPNSIIFITCVTYERKPYLHDEENLRVFWDTVHHVQILHEFELLAYGIMPDHFHWLIKMPEGQPIFSQVIHSVKRNFTAGWKITHNQAEPIHIWQSRFWDHVIRDEIDFKNHLDYIHWNPVKHGYVNSPEQWKQSSYRMWMENGVYPTDWGNHGEPGTISKLNFE